MPKLIKQNDTETLRELIALRAESGDSELVDALVLNLQGTKHSELSHYLFVSLPAHQIGELNYNYFAQQACSAPRSFLQQVIFQSTVLGVKLDIQTYIRAWVSLYSPVAYLSGEESMSLQEKNTFLEYLNLLLIQDQGAVGGAFVEEICTASLNMLDKKVNGSSDEKSAKKRHMKRHTSSDNDAEMMSWEHSENDYIKQQTQNYTELTPWEGQPLKPSKEGKHQRKKAINRAAQKLKDNSLSKEDHEYVRQVKERLEKAINTEIQ